MRWPWQPRPGLVRISQAKLIDLYRDALRAADLDEETRRLRVRTSQSLAGQKVAEVQIEARLTLPTDVAARLVEDAPLTAEGRLHEAAFAALLSQALWHERERPLLDLLTANQNRGGHDAE